jgi:hypothetical protein
MRSRSIWRDPRKHSLAGLLARLIGARQGSGFVIIRRVVLIEMLAQIIRQLVIDELIVLPPMSFIGANTNINLIIQLFPAAAGSTPAILI